MKRRAIVILSGHEAERGGARQDFAFVAVHDGCTWGGVEVIDNAQNVTRIRRPGDDGRHASGRTQLGGNNLGAHATSAQR